MRVRAAVAVAVLALVVAGVVAATRSDRPATSVAADVTVPTTLALDEVTTTTVLGVPTSVLPTITTPSLPRLTTTVKKATSTTAAPARSAGGARCGTPSGYGGVGANRSTTSGAVTATIETYPCEMYEGDYLQVYVMVRDRTSTLRDVRLTYGDGKVVAGGVHPWKCDDPEKPDPYYFNGSTHTYATPGAYTLTATVTTASCDGSGAEQQTTVSMTVYREAGKRPGT